MLQSSGFVDAGHQKTHSSKVTTQIYVQKNPVNCLVNSSEACSSEGSSNSRKTHYIRSHQDRRVFFHCYEAGHILTHCPYKNQGKLKNVPPKQRVVMILKRPNVGKPTSSVDDNVDCELIEVVYFDPFGRPKTQLLGFLFLTDFLCLWNICLLEDVINIDGGYFAFAGNKGGYITGQGTLKNDKVKFEKVNYVEQLKHNLLSVSQLCDKKFSFHFNDSECYILKPGFVIPDEWILMKALRRNDTYVLDMSVATTKDSIPTCLLSKASESDSILWHRKLAHINYRKINYLVKNDLVIGVLKMKFSVPDDCIPCNKGKQH
ncbi:hypothetical protein L1987_06863 [Smallanthus sonchifolius]|uniref:Uncharacterized protein n=1 Tax=Smallanthus sonchifolius TaxID=185202 RepID=A0ACB9JZJ6_9ASTR|nr:hypothetical protein L1987_06863 [Smallanthus sonchifolius]